MHRQIVSLVVTRAVMGREPRGLGDPAGLGAGFQEGGVNE